ncbi:Crustacean neurohormone family-containing protein [Strongyloides ratti]|uniref:Crustacean neurohormone family-containing protein n=1 Tax=Strongyloides ratti TaxID=34506 RepID=A0A090KVZ5_STRRB|nr:Crustacean neurohormone family-containing protein [Strongyloides ratti]CEF59442.1 Crustacean neurohormone family-containing protein [Strongyloides ratti]
MIYSILFITLLPVQICTRSVLLKVFQRSDPMIYDRNGTIENIDISSSEDCDIYRNKEFHLIVDTVCEACHEMFSQNFPNLRVQCRANCFRNENFSSCLKIFKPQDTTFKIKRNFFS